MQKLILVALLQDQNTEIKPPNVRNVGHCKVHSMTQVTLEVVG